MSGHNKWSKIKHKKAATDAQRSKEFSKIVRLIKVEAKKAGGDLNAPGLRTVIDKAKAANMPKDNIDKAIKGATEGPGDNEVTYEAYGPGGCALIITGLTDNNNRTTQEIKHLLSKNGLELAAQGAASWAFTKTAEGFEPQTMVTLSDEDGGKLGKLLELLDEHDDVQEIYTNAE